MTLLLFFHNVTSFDLTMTLRFYLALVSYLHGIFVIPSAAFSQSLRLQLSLFWSRQPTMRKQSALI